ncbi:unnamed protein product, partial [Closterium sp. Yama58-4]
MRKAVIEELKKLETDGRVPPHSARSTTVIAATGPSGGGGSSGNGNELLLIRSETIGNHTAALAALQSPLQQLADSVQAAGPTHFFFSPPEAIAAREGGADTAGQGGAPATAASAEGGRVVESHVGRLEAVEHQHAQLEHQCQSLLSAQEEELSASIRSTAHMDAQLSLAMPLPPPSALKSPAA